MDDSAITCDEIIESYDDETNFNEKKQPVKCKIDIFYLLYFYISKILYFHFYFNFYILFVCIKKFINEYSIIDSC